MAEADDTRACPVCFEEYSAEGDHTPKLLPCTHSLCQSCVHQLRKSAQQGAGFTCPICKEKFPGRRDFPENRYILALLRYSKVQKDEESEESWLDVEKCTDHAQDLTLHCVTCSAAICKSCVEVKHAAHVTSPLEQHLEPQKRALRHQFRILLGDVRAAQSVLEQARAKARGDYHACASHMEREQAHMEKRFRETGDRVETVRKEAGDAGRSLRRSEVRETSLAETRARLWGLRFDLLRALRRHGHRSFSHTWERGSQGAAGAEVGRTAEEAEEAGPNHRITSEDKTIDASAFYPDIQCSEIATISDLASDFVQLWVGAAGNLFVLYCPRKLLGRLEKLALATGIVLQSVDLTLFYEHVYKTLFKSTHNARLTECAPVRLDGEDSIAVYTYSEIDLRGETRYISEIEFRSQNNLRTVLLRHEFKERKQPLGVFPPAVLLLIDHDGRLKYLDCSTNPPKETPAGPKLQRGIRGHCTEYQGQDLYISCSSSGVYCDNVETGALVWTTQGKHPQNLDACDVTTDGRCIFVADSGNACVQMFSLSDGQYLGRVLEGEERGKPCCVAWSGEMSSLIVGFLKKGEEGEKRGTLNLVQVQFK